MFLLHLLLVSLALLTVDVAAQAKKGQNELTLDNLQTSLTNGYNHKYRPPSPNGNATQVRLSLRSLRLLQFDPSQSLLSLTFNTLQQYNDTRLQFPAKAGLRTLQLPPKINLWRPKLDFPATLPPNAYTNGGAPLIVDYEMFDSFMSNMLVPRTTFVSSGGSVAIRRGLDEKQLLLRGKETSNGTKFTLQIAVKQQLGDVRLVWDENKPVTFEGEGENVTVISEELRGQGRQEFQLTNLTRGICKREQDFGSFGTFQYSCLKVEFYLEPVSNNNSNYYFMPRMMDFSTTPSYMKNYNYSAFSSPRPMPTSLPMRP